MHASFKFILSWIEPPLLWLRGKKGLTWGVKIKVTHAVPLLPQLSNSTSLQPPCLLLFLSPLCHLSSCQQRWIYFYLFHLFHVFISCLIFQESLGGSSPLWRGMIQDPSKVSSLKKYPVWECHASMSFATLPRSFWEMKVVPSLLPGGSLVADVVE